MWNMLTLSAEMKILSEHHKTNNSLMIAFAIFAASVTRINKYIYIYICIMIHINHLYKIFNLIQTFTHPVFGGVVGVVVSRLTRATFRNNFHGQNSAVRRRCIFWIWPSNIFWIFLDIGRLWLFMKISLIVYWILGDNHWWSLII